MPVRSRLLPALAAAALSSGALFSSVAPASAQAVKVGLLAPFSGTYAALGEDIEAGFQLAVATYGEGLDVDVVRADSEAKPPVGLARARRLVLQERVDVVVGVVSSAVLGAVRDFLHESETPIIVANAGNNDMTGPRCSPYVIRVSFSNAQINRPMGGWLYEQGVRRVFTLAPDYAAGHQMIEAFEETFVAAGGEIVGGTFSPFGQTNDFAPYLAAAAARQPDAIYAFYSGGEAVSFVRQYADFGFADDIPIYGPAFLTSPLHLAAQGPAAHGIIGATHYVADADTPENQAFRAAFEAETGRAPSEFAVQGYDAGRLMIEALRAGGDPRALAAAMPSVSFIGPRGPLEIDPATNNVVQTISIVETVVTDDAMGHRILAQFPDQRDPANGCVLE